jgi:CBS domain-containing protein
MSTTSAQPYRGSYLMPSLEKASVADAMHPGIRSCEPDAKLTEVARIMSTHHIHSLAVVGISHEDPPCGVWGIVSDLDVVGAGIRNGQEQTARELAQEPVVTVEPATPLREAGELMLTNRVSHLIVIEPGTQRPIGVLSSSDLMGVLAWGEA